MSKKLHDIISSLLTQKLKKYSSSSVDSRLNSTTCIEIYSDIFNTLVDVIKEAKTPIGNESINYISQQYYDGIVINEQHELDPNIFTQRAKLENIDTKELSLLAMILNGTEFVYEVIREIKKRS